MLKIIRLVVVIVATCVPIASAVGFDRGDASLKWVCEKLGLECGEMHDQCELYTTINNKRFVLTSLSRDLMCRSSIYYHSKNLAEVRTNCGTYCTVSIFYQFSTRKLSPAINDVLGVDVMSECAVKIDLEGLKLVSIFESGKESALLIKESELSQNSAIPAEAITSVKFKGGQVYIDYVNKDEKNKTKIVTIR